MLDQNTDRMWYVIGAVVLGAGILLLLNSTALDLFAQVTGTFGQVTNTATEAAGNIHSSWNLVAGRSNQDGYVVTYREGDQKDDGLVEGDVRVTYHPSGQVTHSHVANVPVEPNTTYLFTGPEGVYAPRVGFYDEQGNTIGTLFNTIDADNTKESIEQGTLDTMVFTTPANVDTLTISAERGRYFKNRSSHVEDWILTEDTDENKQHIQKERGDE